MATMHCIVYGKVQGVWYRAWTKDTAMELGIHGDVRNMPDGTVEIVAQAADEHTLEAFIERLQDGPPLARVTKVLCSPVKDAQEYDRFTVSH